MPVETTNPVKATANPNSVSARIIAAGIVIAFCYWASTVLVTLVVAVLMAYFLDPVVNWLEEWHVPRALGALIVVLSTICLMLLLAWTLILRFDQFGQDWPNYQKPLKAVASAVSKKLETFESHVSEIEPSEKPGERIIAVADSNPIKRRALPARCSRGSFRGCHIPAVPFIFHARSQTTGLARHHAAISSHRANACETDPCGSDACLTQLRDWHSPRRINTRVCELDVFHEHWTRDFPFLAALVSGSVNLIPYFGVVLSWFPPVIIGLKRFKHVEPYIGIVVMMTVLHLIAANLLMPALVGWRVRLNALALTVALLLWGWLWGPMGLILAVPITAVIKVICDHVESLQPVGRWLSA